MIFIGFFLKKLGTNVCFEGNRMRDFFMGSAPPEVPVKENRGGIYHG